MNYISNTLIIQDPLVIDSKAQAFSRLKISIYSFVETHQISLNSLTLGQLIDNNKAVILKDANVTLPLSDVDLIIKQIKDDLFVIRAKEKAFLFEREELADKGPWFSHILNSSMIEGSKREVTLSDDTSEAIGIFLRFLRGDKIALTRWNVIETLELATKYQVTKLTELCIEFLHHMTLTNRTNLTDHFSNGEEFRGYLANIGCLNAYLARRNPCVRVLATSNSVPIWAMTKSEEKRFLRLSIYTSLDELQRYSSFELYLQTEKFTFCEVNELIYRFPKMKGFGLCTTKGFIECSEELNRYLDLFATPEESVSNTGTKPVLRALDLRKVSDMDATTIERVSKYFPYLYYLFLKTPLVKQVTCNEALLVSVSDCVQLETLDAPRAETIYALNCSKSLQINAPETCTNKYE